MAWTYKQSTGELFHNGTLVGTGYAGAGDGKNNPDMQQVHNVGPLPQGEYDIQPPQDTVTHGPFVLPLVPSENNEMFGRSAFLIHGDSVVNPGTASQGCIIMPKAVRKSVWNSGDRELQVIA